MTKQQITQQKKNEALNAIRKLYHPLYKMGGNIWDEESSKERRDSIVEDIITKLNEEIK